MGNLKKNITEESIDKSHLHFGQEKYVETLKGFELDLTVLIQIKCTESTQFIIPEITQSDMDDL